MIEHITLATVVISLLFLGWHSREVARQTRITSQVAGAAGLRDSLTNLHSVIQIFVEHPELRPYFYGGMDAQSMRSSAPRSTPSPRCSPIAWTRRSKRRTCSTHSPLT